MNQHVLGEDPPEGAAKIPLGTIQKNGGVGDLIGGILNVPLNPEERFTEIERMILKLFIDNLYVMYSRDDLIDIIRHRSSGAIQGLELGKIINGIKNELPDGIEICHISYKLFYAKKREFNIDDITDKIPLGDDIYLVPKMYSLYVNRKLVYFSPKQYVILERILLEPNKVFGISSLLDILGDYGDIYEGTLVTYISRINKRLLNSGVSIRHKKGRGYYAKIGELDIDEVQDKIQLCENIFFIPQYNTISGPRLSSNLTGAQSEILLNLISEPNIFRRDIGKYSGDSLKSLISGLRKKLNSVSPGLGLKIVSEYGGGYKWGQ